MYCSIANKVEDVLLDNGLPSILVCACGWTLYHNGSAQDSGGVTRQEASGLVSGGGRGAGAMGLTGRGMCIFEFKENWGDGEGLDQLQCRAASIAVAHVSGVVVCRQVCPLLLVLIME